MAIADWLLNNSKKFKEFKKAVESSFFKIKEFDEKQDLELKKLHNLVSEVEGKINQNNTSFNDLKLELVRISTLLGENVKKINPNKDSGFTGFTEPKIKSTSNKPAVYVNKRIIDPEEVRLMNFTELEKKCFIVISSLQKELKEDWIPVSDVNNELYPKEPEEKMRSTVSNALSKLDSYKIIDRARKGKKYFVKLTDSGVKLYGKEVSSKAKKALTRR